MPPKKVVEGRSEERDPGESDQNQAIAAGLTDSPALASGKCPTCGRDLPNT